MKCHTRLGFSGERAQRVNRLRHLCFPDIIVLFRNNSHWGNSFCWCFLVFFIMLSCSNFSISSSTFLRRWKGILRLTVSSIASSTCLFFSLPSPLKTGACLSKIRWRFFLFARGLEFVCCSGLVWVVFLFIQLRCKLICPSS